MDRVIRITLDKEYCVDIDPLNYTLKQRYKGKTKDGSSREGERIIGYYGNLRQCVEKYMTENQLDELAGQEMPLVQYVRMVENANKKTMNAQEDSLQRVGRIPERDQEGL